MILSAIIKIIGIICCFLFCSFYLVVLISIGVSSGLRTFFKTNERGKGNDTKK